MFHGINELRNKVYPPNRPEMLEAARRKRLADGKGRSTDLDAASPDAGAKSAQITDESRAVNPGDGKMAA